jgi:AraC-like DNA-binding protein
MVAAVLAPDEVPRVEAAGQGCFRLIERPSIADAIRAVRERPVDAILVSVRHCSPADLESLRRLVQAFPGLPAVALVTRHDPTTPEMLLQLGASGVNNVVDVTDPAGWNRLRRLVTEPASRPAARILGPVLARLPGLPDDARLFLEAMVRLAPNTPTVRGLARLVRVRASTLTSRFSRAGLPSAKRYLAAIRLLYAAQYFENEGLSVSDVAYRLECSSPQSFSRHVRLVLGITSREFRGRYPFGALLRRFLELLVDPYVDRWKRFRPLARQRGFPARSLSRQAGQRLVRSDEVVNATTL